MGNESVHSRTGLAHVELTVNSLRTLQHGYHTTYEHLTRKRFTVSTFNTVHRICYILSLSGLHYHMITCTGSNLLYRYLNPISLEWVMCLFCSSTQSKEGNRISLTKEKSRVKEVSCSECQV